MNALAQLYGSRRLTTRTQEAPPELGLAEQLMAERDHLLLELREAELELEHARMPLLPMQVRDALAGGLERFARLIAEHHPELTFHDLRRALEAEPDMFDEGRLYVRCHHADYHAWNTARLLDEPVADNLDFDVSGPERGRVDVEGPGTRMIAGPLVACEAWLRRLRAAVDKWGVGDWLRYRQELEGCPRYVRYGLVQSVQGNLCRISGLRCGVGELVEIEADGDRFAAAKVVADDQRVVSAIPFGGTGGLRAGLRVRRMPVQRAAHAELSPGRAYNAFAEPIDNLPPFLTAFQPAPPRRVAEHLDPRPVDRQLLTGVRVLDLFTPLGYGQRIGIFAPPGTGKSTLLNQIMSGLVADQVIVTLVGERRRELAEFLDAEQGLVGDPRYTVIAATADDPPPLQLRAAELAMATARRHARAGRDVVIMLDSLTRLAHAWRSEALLGGEAPVRRGYPSGLATFFAGLLEQAGNFADAGSITVITTVLTEGEVFADDPVAEAAQAILDGHILLSRRQAEQGLFPAVDVLASISRVGDRVQAAALGQVASRLRSDLSRYEESRDLILLGAYQKGNDPELDRAVDVVHRLRHFCTQPPDEHSGADQLTAQLARHFPELME